MSVDREQARQLAQSVQRGTGEGRSVWRDLADITLALLAELEQSERIAKHFEQSAETQHNWVHKLEDLLAQERWKVEQAEARLAAVPALVEALQAFADIARMDEAKNPPGHRNSVLSLHRNFFTEAMKALAAYQQANP